MTKCTDSDTCNNKDCLRYSDIVTGKSYKAECGYYEPRYMEGKKNVSSNDTSKGTKQV